MICCDCNLRKIFSALWRKRARPWNNFITTTFGKSLFITQYHMRYTTYIPLNAKDLTVVDLTMLAYENWQNAIKFAGANSSDLLLALKPGLRKNKQKTLDHLYVSTQGRDHCNVLDVYIETLTSWLESLCACITLSIVSSA